ncbi:alpha/beta hydrolase [Gimesia sp.]|uniref:alpha/beta hydrolase n=1 Tax=Gimesia sp. TaxID=2024833 RepID=UPI003A91A08B
MLFITNRIPIEGIETEIDRKFTFDPANADSSKSVFFCERKSNGSITEIGSAALLNKIKESECKQILLYIHGYANQPADIFKAAQEFQSLCNKSKRKEVLVVPLIWPCSSENSIASNYWDDQKSADASGYAFSRVIQRFIEWRNSPDNDPELDPCLKRINVLAHSMGNRVYRETLYNWNYYDLPDGVPLIFRNSFLIAADVVNETLEPGQKGEHICNASRNVVVYYASDDLALRASKGANLKSKIASRRLGHSGPEDLTRVPKNVYSVDCDDINTQYDYPKGHTYFRSGTRKGQSGVVFKHIFEVLLTGRVPEKTSLINTSILEPARVPSKISTRRKRTKTDK